jgi:hypothetical protein
MQYLIVAVLFIIAVSACGYVAFKFGYNLGWQERQQMMTLRRKPLAQTNARLDDDERYERHSAIDPKKPVWH